MNVEQSRKVTTYEIKSAQKILPYQNSDGFYMCKIRKIS